jgi:hypothetical protein
VEAAEECRDLRLTRGADFEQLSTAELAAVSGEDMAGAIAAVHARLNIGD